MAENRGFDLIFGTEREKLAHLETTVGELRQWLLDNQTEYDEAVIRRTDHEWLGDVFRVVVRVNEALATHKPEDPPHQAVYLLAQARSSLDSVVAQVAFISEYESRRESYRAVVTQFQDDKRSVAAAG